MEVGVRLQQKGSAYALFVASAAALAACASAPPKSPDQERADAATAERVYAALDQNPIYYFRDVEVSVDYGVARLSGYVWTTDALYRAQEIARSVPGVTGVQDAIELERQGNRGGGDGAGGS
jgi:hyperosmotically inducible periplasmic protein